MGGAVLAIKGVLMTDLMIAREHRFNEDAPAIAFVRAWISFVYGYGRGRVKSLMFALCFRRGRETSSNGWPCSFTRGKYLIWNRDEVPINERNVQNSNLKISAAVERIGTRAVYYFSCCMEICHVRHKLHNKSVMRWKSCQRCYTGRMNCVE